MIKISKILYLVCFLLLFLSCSNRNTSSRVRAYSDSEGSNTNSNSFQDPTSDRFIVPPEIAIVSATISATASSFNEATELIETNSNKFFSSLNKIEGCSVNIIDYSHPAAWNYRKIASSNDSKYSSSIDLEIQIDFTSAKDIPGRIERLNNCLQVVSEMKLEKIPENKSKSIYLSLSKAIPTVKDVAKYRQQLLIAKFKPLKTVASIAEPASQFKALDTKCTSQGIVTVSDRSLKGIELDIDLDCRRRIDNQAAKNPN